ncbi:MAG TPA: hypothetical protein VKD25_01885 [Burkholderiales bacterium]|nr:hypothetical protein [Burkholderiales bacterium]
MEHAAKTPAGALSLAAFALYALLAALFYYPDYPASVWPIAGAGILACLAVAFNSAYWRLAVILASCVYLGFYVTRVMRMVVLTSGFEISSLPSALGLYFKSLWGVTTVMVYEKGVAASLMHGYIEYVMPVLSLVLIVLAWMSRRRAVAESTR